MTTKVKLQLLAGIGAVIGFFMLLGIGGDIDYTDQCILQMTEEEYDTIRQELTRLHGSAPSERDIAHYWAERHR